MSRWVLYVDESGRPEDEGDLHVVAGLLLRAADSEALHRSLRDAIARIYPLWPWPPHAAHLNIPASRVAAAMARPRPPHESEAARSLRAMCAPLCDAIGSSSEPAALAFMDSVARWSDGAALDWDTTRRADRVVRRARPEAHALLKRVCQDQEQQMQALLSGIGGVPQARACAFVAVSPRGAGATPVAGPEVSSQHRIVRDRYVRTMQVLVERVSLLLQAEDRQDVRIFVATRDVAIQGIRPRNRQGIPLYPHFVGDLISDATRGLPKAGRPPRMLPLGSPNRYDASALPGLVLADWIANRARRALAPSRGHTAEQSLVAHGGLGLASAPLPVVFVPMSGGDALPTLAAEGRAAEQVRAAMSGQAPSSPLEPEWVRGFTDPWTDAALRWGR